MLWPSKAMVGVCVAKPKTGPNGLTPPAAQSHTNTCRLRNFTDKLGPTITEQTQPFYNHYAGQSVLAGTPS